MSDDSDRPTKRQKRLEKVSLYDVVAGRAGLEGFLSEPTTSKHRDTQSTSTSTAVPPEDVLFRQRDAPVRYEEDDVYWADRHLKLSQQLPDSDLLKALHRYASDFFGTMRGNKLDSEGMDFRSLDETALLALGILIEEAAAEAIGETGDLALLQPAEKDGEDG